MAVTAGTHCVHDDCRVTQPPSTTNTRAPAFINRLLLQVTDLAVHSSGRILASASNDHTVRLWALNHTQIPCVAVLEPPSITLGIASNAPPPLALPIVQCSWRPEAHPDALPELLAVSLSGACSVWSARDPSSSSDPEDPTVHGWALRTVQAHARGAL